MGNVPHLEIHADQESEAEPGTKCLCTAPLGELEPNLTLEDAFDEIEMWHRSPEQPVWQHHAMTQRVEVEDLGHTGDSFSTIIKVYLDGKQLDAAGIGRGDGMNKVAFWKRCTINWTKMVCTNEHYVNWLAGGEWADEASNEEVVLRDTVYAVRDPPRVELCVDIRGVREASWATKESLAPWAAVLVQNRVKAVRDSVKVAPGIASRKVPGAKSNVSEPLDDLDISFDELFDNMAKVLLKKVATMRNVSTIEQTNGTSSEQTVTAEASIPWTTSFLQTESEFRRVVRQESEFKKETGEITVHEVAITEDGSVAWPPWSRVTTVVIHWVPFIVESWVSTSREDHISDKVGARRLQEWVNAALTKATSLLG